MSLRRRRQSKLAHTMATVVHTDLMREFARHMINLQHIVKELHNVHNLFRGNTLVLTLKNLRVIHLHVSGT